MLLLLGGVLALGCGLAGSASGYNASAQLAEEESLRRQLLRNNYDYSDSLSLELAPARVREPAPPPAPPPASPKDLLYYMDDAHLRLRADSAANVHRGHKQGTRRPRYWMLKMEDEGQILPERGSAEEQTSAGGDSGPSAQPRRVQTPRPGPPAPGPPDPAPVPALQAALNTSDADDVSVSDWKAPEFGPSRRSDYNGTADVSQMTVDQYQDVVLPRVAQKHVARRLAPDPESGSDGPQRPGLAAGEGRYQASDMSFTEDDY